MRIEVDEEGDLILKEVYNGIGFISPNGEIFNICMRDGGYEFQYGGTWYRAVGGKLEKLK